MAARKKTGKRAVKKTAVDKARGRRYSADEKSKILTHVEQVNAEKGRGGIAAAAAKFGVTPLTIGTWMRNAGLPTRGGGMSQDSPKIFQRLAELHEQILQAESRLSELKREYTVLKRKL